MGVALGKPLLFLDLDEVLVTRLTHGAGQETIVVLQPTAVEELRPFAGEVLVLTHRSRAEALQILQAFPGITDILLDVVAADDVIRGAFVTGQFISLLRGGIQKSLYVRIANRKYGVQASRIAILDDNPGNIDGVLSCGGGLALLAPKPEILDGRVTTFGIGAALTAFRDFRDGAHLKQSRIVLPSSQQFALVNLPQAHVAYARKMNRVRRAAKTVRCILSMGK